MELKKNKKYDLESKRSLFFGIGMILALGFVITAFEWKTEIEPIDLFVVEVDESWDTEIILATEHKKKEPPKPKIKRKPIEVVEAKNELKETAEDIPFEIDDPFDDEGFTPDFGNEFVEAAIDPPLYIVEKMPSYPGGIEEFYQFLGSKIKYPSQAKRIGTEGKVFIKFIVEKDGSLSNLEVIKGIGSGCDLEALRVLKLASNFNPGKQRGIPVRVQMVVPINFQLK